MEKQSQKPLSFKGNLRNLARALELFRGRLHLCRSYAVTVVGNQHTILGHRNPLKGLARACTMISLNHVFALVGLLI
jgi:hypothetical protein